MVLIQLEVTVIGLDIWWNYVEVTVEWSKNPWECDCLSYNFIELNETIPATAHTVLCQTPEQFKGIYLDDINIDCVVPETTETFVTTSHPSTTEIMGSTSQQSFTETVGTTSHSKTAETELLLVFFSGVYVAYKHRERRWPRSDKFAGKNSPLIQKILMSCFQTYTFFRVTNLKIVHWKPDAMTS